MIELRRNKLLVLMFIGILFGTLILNIASNWNPRTNNSNGAESQASFQSDLTTQNVVTRNFMSGTGVEIKAGLFTNISATESLNSPYYEESGNKYFNLPINTNHQNISQTNLTFSGITAQNSSQIIEDNPENFIANGYHPLYLNVAIMSFKVPSPCKLKQVSLFLQEANATARWSIAIYNATRDLEEDLNVIPSSPIGVVITQNATNPKTLYAAHWQDFTFPDSELNMTNTYVDSEGFAYYFLMVALPICYGQSTVSLLYYSYDVTYVDDGFAYFIVYGYSSLEYEPWDYCMKLVLAPESPTPTPSEVGLSVLNPSRPAPTTMRTEDNHSVSVEAARNVTTGLYLLSQNFTLTDYGTINGIGLYIKCYGDILACVVGIFPDNNSRPNWNANKLLDLNVTLNLEDGTTGWINFTMSGLPNLPPGTYWWVLEIGVNGNENITLFGANDSFGDNAIALKTYATTGPHFTSNVLPYDFASIIYYQPGRAMYNVSQSWISSGHLLPDMLGYITFQIITRWLGDTAFNVTYTVELENNRYVEPCYLAYFNTNTIWWNITLFSSFPTTSLGKIINLTLPLSWSVKNVTRNGQDHGSSNWSVYQFTAFKILSIYRASDAQWTVWCNTTPPTLSYIIEKLVGTQFQPASNATVYDKLRVNVTIPTQSNGICFVTIFYPDGKSMFKNQTSITTETILLNWYPENDSAATGGNYTFIVHWSNGTAVGFSRQYFFFTPIPTTLTLISSLPSPYVNDNTKNITILYCDSRGVNITGATLFANLYGTALDWEDLYSISLNPLKRGLYLIKLNTAGLNASQSYPLSVSAQRDGYSNVSLASQQILVRPVPTTLVTNVQNITQYQDQFMSFSCSFKDNFHATGIDWASIGFTIVGTSINGSMTSIMPGESIYVTGNVALSNLTGKTLPYVINITAIARNCETNNKTINLFVLNKTGTILTLIIPIGLIIQGQSLQIQAYLQNESSLRGISGATIRFSFGGIIPDRIALTDSNGIATIDIAVPDQPFTVTAFYDGTSTIKGTPASPSSVSVLTYADLALWIGIIAGVCVVSIIAARQLYFVPKRNRRMQQYQKIANKFQDVANLRQLIILHKESGGCLYQQSFGGEFDADLISGFLSAISSFQTELKPEKALQKGIKTGTGGFQLSYQDYKILLFDGTLIRMALIVDELPSEEFRKLAQSFVGEYEERYRSYLTAWRGDVTPFKDSYHFIATSLEITLIWPHQLRKPAPSEKLNSLEESAIKIADTIMKSQAANYFFLPLVISMGQAGAPQAKLEIIATAYKLRYRNIFNPVDPSNLTT